MVFGRDPTRKRKSFPQALVSNQWKYMFRKHVMVSVSNVYGPSAITCYIQLLNVVLEVYKNTFLRIIKGWISTQYLGVVKSMDNE